MLPPKDGCEPSGSGGVPAGRGARLLYYPQALLWTLTLGRDWRREGQASGPETGGAEIPLVLVPGELPRAWGWEAGADREVNWAQRCLRLHLQLDRGGKASLSRASFPLFIKQASFLPWI